MSYEFSTTPTSRCGGGVLRARADQTPARPISQKSGSQFGFLSEIRPLRKSGISSKRIKQASTFDIAGDAGGGYVLPAALTKAALARKSKHPKDLNRHGSFR